MIRIYFSDGQEIDLVGKEEDLNKLKDELDNFLKSNSLKLKIAVDVNVDPMPYEKMLRNLIVIKGNGANLISVNRKTELQIEGSVKCLDSFSANVRFVANNGNHLHYEYFEGNNFISPKSIPLIISQR